MSAARPSPPPPDPSAIDHFVYLNVGWDDYEKLLAMRGEKSAPRITYVHGVVELMSPSSRHELDKKRFARLLEAWSEVAGVQLEGYGSWTLQNKRLKVAAEADECYTVGRLAVDDRDRPDIAIEVVWTSGGVDKLEVYRKLGVREVWFYERGSLRFFALRGAGTSALRRDPYQRARAATAAGAAARLHARAEPDGGPASAQGRVAGRLTLAAAREDRAPRENEERAIARTPAPA